MYIYKKVAAGLAVVLVVAVPRPDPYTVAVSHMKVAAGLAAVLVVAFSRPDPYSCVTYEGGSWAGSWAGGSCLQA